MFKLTLIYYLYILFLYFQKKRRFLFKLNTLNLLPDIFISSLYFYNDKIMLTYISVDQHFITIMIKISNQYNLKGNFAIFYMLAKYVLGDKKYIFTKFYRHISTNNEANRKFVILISNFSIRLWHFSLIMHCGIKI